MTETLDPMGTNYPSPWEDYVAETDEGWSLRVIITTHSYLLDEWFLKRENEEIDEGEPPEKPDGMLVEIQEDPNNQEEEIYDVTINRRELKKSVVKKVIQVLNEEYDEDFEHGDFEA